MCQAFFLKGWLQDNGLLVCGFGELIDDKPLGDGPEF